jgi:hypothetical protein
MVFGWYDNSRKLVFHMGSSFFLCLLRVILLVYAKV